MEAGGGCGRYRSSVGRPSLLVAPGEAAPRRHALGISSPSPVLAVIGTTTDLDVELDAQLLPAVLAAVDVVARSRAVIVTGGTDAGVFHLVRLALAVASSPPAGIVGVAPDGLVAADDGPPSADRVDVDPGLTALVRVKGDQWGDETPMLSRVVTELAVPGRAAVLLVGGGDGTRVEVKEHLRQRRPIVVLGGSGRMADEVAAGGRPAATTRSSARCSPTATCGSCRCRPAPRRCGRAARAS